MVKLRKNHSAHIETIEAYTWCWCNPCVSVCVGGFCDVSLGDVESHKADDSGDYDTVIWDTESNTMK